MRVRLLYFAWVREQLGRDSETLDIPDDVASIGDLAKWLACRDDQHAIVFHDSRLRAAIDQAMCSFDAPIAGATEIAFFPPVTGG